MSKTRKAARVEKLPTSWSGLVRLHPLRPIHDEIDNTNATELIDALAGHDLTADQADYLESLSTLVMAYDDAHHALETADLSGLDVLRSLLDDHAMSGADLGRLLDIHRTHANKIVSGDRSITADHARTLGGHFKLDPGVFVR